MKPLARIVHIKKRLYEVIHYNNRYGYWPKRGKKYNLEAIEEFLKREKDNLEILFARQSGRLEEILATVNRAGSFLSGVITHTIWKLKKLK